MTHRLLSLLVVFCLFLACSSGGSAPATAPENAPAGMEEATTSGPVYEDLSPAEFAGRIGSENTVILDVRTPAETAGGVIEGALELDYRSPNFKSELLKLDKDKTYLVYCASGIRSGKACEMLQEAGFAEMYNLTGGYRAWVE